MTTDPEHSRTVPSRFYCLLYALLLTCIVCFGNLNKPFSRADELIYVRATQGMLDSGVSLVPTLNGAPFFNKPPLSTWLSCLSVTTLGESARAHRLPSACAGALLFLLVFFIAVHLSHSWPVGAIAVTALASSRVLLLMNGVRTACTDSLLALCTTLVVWGGYILVENVLRGSSGPRQRALAFGVGCVFGLGILAKSLAIGIAIPIGGTYLLIRWWQARFPIGATLVKALPLLVSCVSGALLFPLPYYVAVFMRYPEAWEVVVRQELVLRVAKGYHHRRDLFLYLRQIFLSHKMLPPLLSTLGLALGIRELLRSRGPRMALLLPWALIPPLCFSCIPSRLPWYINAAIPPLAILIGIAVVEIGKTLQRLTSGETALQIGDSTLVGRIRRGVLHCLPSAWILVVAGVFGISFHTVVSEIVHEPPLYFDDVVEVLRRHGEPQVPIFISQDVLFDQLEEAYSHFLGDARRVIPGAQLSGLSDAHERAFLITTLSALTTLPTTAPWSAYLWVPPFKARTTPLIVLYRGPAVSAPPLFRVFQRPISGADFVRWLKLQMYRGDGTEPRADEHSPL